MVLNDNNSNRPQGPIIGNAGPVSMIVGFAALISIAAGVLPSLWAGLPMLLFCAFVFVLIYDASKNQQAPTVGSYALLLAIGACALAGLPIYEFHWISFTLAGWIVEGLYVAGLVFGILAKVNTLLRVLAVLVAGALAAALVNLPVPTRSIAPDDQSRRWYADVTVRNVNDEPIANARVACTAVMRWNARQAPYISDFSAEATDDQGRASFAFDEDGRMKVALCAAHSPPSEYGSGNSNDYTANCGVGAWPLPGGRVPVTIRLNERAAHRNGEAGALCSL